MRKCFIIFANSFNVSMFDCSAKLFTNLDNIIKFYQAKLFSNNEEGDVVDLFEWSIDDGASDDVRNVLTIGFYEDSIKFHEESSFAFSDKDKEDVVNVLDFLRGSYAVRGINSIVNVYFV